ncbi:MAG TPA: IPT/TIG domain-containing protein [Candidatus Dormibacteraeota bacterium]|nr:IPT/TIG domain-containing protein [Candidatus Dormibacteraeota bacterium]
MTRQGADYSFGPMPGATATANGLTFIGRYVSTPGSSKNLTAAEITDFQANGIGIIVFFEQAEDNSLGGQARGVSDAQTASAQVAALGIADCPIYFAVDFAVTPAQLPTIGAYLQGAASVVDLTRSGVYGPYAVVKYAFDNNLVTYGCQTAVLGEPQDWRCQIYQYSHNVAIATVLCDRDRTVSSDSDYGQVGAVVSAISPNGGDMAGGTVVTIYGRGFTVATGVRFGATNATSFTIVSDGQITATSPAAGTTGTVDVTVLTAAGASATGDADLFSYSTIPTITSFSPTTGDAAGGTIVAITGSGFFGVTAVNFGANAAVTYNIDSETQITAVSPPGVGNVNLSVRTPAGSSASTLATQFSYVSANPAQAPQVTAVNPATGTTAGGDSVVISGAGFTGAGAVKFGTTAAAGFNVDSDTQITATTPAMGAGVIDITVTTPAGTSPASAADQFTFAVPLPVVTSVNPNTGSAAGGTSVTITGTAFTGVSAVNFGTLPSAFSFDSDTQITATSPVGTSATTVDILVTTPAGTSAATAADQFAWLAASAPAVTSINPTSGATAGGDTVTITGSGFTGTISVGFGLTASPNVTVNSDTQITAVSPAGAATVDVTVITPVGTSAISAADKFTYGTIAAAPTVTAISPTNGAAGGGDAVTITGSGFTGATAVNFGGNAATGVTVNSDTQITATSPAGTSTVDVKVTTPAGTSGTGPADQFTYVTAGLPSVSSVNPNTGAAAGGDSVTIIGTGFTGATDVGFGATGAVFTVDSDTQITATTPGGTTGPVDVIVTVPAGNSPISASDVFTYV